MSQTETSTALHKEFELERIILFSDAVFAIAITLLIIEIRFPELPANYRESLDLFKMFQPTIVHFVGLLVSFVLIGFSWARHLNTFRFLKGYDNGLIVRNLVSLLFIITFPFSAEGITHMRPSFMFPMIIYLGNITAVAVAHFWLTYYIFKQKPFLSLSGNEAEKNYNYRVAKATAIGLTAVFICILGTAIISNFNNDYINQSALVFVPAVLYIKRTTRKYKPGKTKTVVIEDSNEKFVD